MPRRQKASTIFSFRRNGRHSTVENGWTQKGTGFIGLLKILSYAKPVIPRPVRRLVVGIRSLFAGFLFRSDGCFSFVGNVPPTAHFSHQLEKRAKAHTVVSADFQSRCGVKIGTLPRNHLASSATGGASLSPSCQPVSSRLHGVKTGTLPRNRLAVSATGGASAISSQ